MEKRNVVVLFGGNSVERDISILSAIQVMKAMDSTLYNIIPVYLTNHHTFLENSEFDSLEAFQKEIKGDKVYFESDNDKVYLVKKGIFPHKRMIDFVFNIVHGKNVEDGTLAGFLETLGVSYSSCSVLASSIFQNKHYTKILLDYYGINTLPHLGFLEEEWMEKSNACLKQAKELGFPLMIKANSLGSSIGIFKVKNEEDLFWALSTAFKYDKMVIVEKALEDYSEYNQAIFKDYLSSIEEVKGDKDFLSFANKYEGSSVVRTFPANISKSLEEEISSITSQIASIFQIKGVIRVDYLFDNESQKLYVNEINTIPGSLAFYLFENKEFKELLKEMVDEGKRYDYLEGLKINTFDSHILNNFQGFNNK